MIYENKDKWYYCWAVHCCFRFGRDSGNLYEHKCRDESDLFLLVYDSEQYMDWNIVFGLCDSQDDESQR